MTRGIRTLGTGTAALWAIAALGAAVLLVGVLADPANGAVKIYRTNQQATLLGKITKGDCQVGGKRKNRYFKMTATSTNRAYHMYLIILDWRGYRPEYNFHRGTNDPGVFNLRGPGRNGTIYSNIFAPPGTDGHPAGGVGFRERGTKLSVGFLPTPNANFKKGVVLAGTMRCL